MRDIRQKVIADMQKDSLNKIEKLIKYDAGDMDGVIAELKASRECLMQMIQKQETGRSKDPIDADRVFGQKGFFGADSRIILKKISSEESAVYRKLIIETSVMPHSMKEMYLESVWKDYLNPARIYCSVYDRGTHALIGYCGIKDGAAADLELAVELLEEYHRKGYGFHALSVFLNGMAEKTGRSQYRVRMDADNYASMGLFEKLGAVPNGISEFMLHGEETLREAEEKNLGRIDAQVRATAAKFGVEPRKLLSHVLEYRLDWKAVSAEAFTHAGIFHADDVFSYALLKILNPDIRITRGGAVPEHFSGIVFDIGGGEFDHHQKKRRVRKNGVPFAAFGLLWEQFGRRLLSREDAQAFDEDFIQPLDLSDNTGAENMLAQMIEDQNPTWEEAWKNPDEAFEKAAACAQKILKDRFRQIRAVRSAYQIVCQKARQCTNGILYLDCAMPWKEAVKNKNIFYVIFPSVRGGYNIQAVPAEEGGMQLKLPFPKSWRGAGPEELRRLTGIAHLVFCHMSGFLCAAQTLESARRTAELALKTAVAGAESQAELLQ